MSEVEACHHRTLLLAVEGANRLEVVVEVAPDLAVSNCREQQQDQRLQPMHVQQLIQPPEEMIKRIFQIRLNKAFYWQIHTFSDCCSK